MDLGLKNVVQAREVLFVKFVNKYYGGFFSVSTHRIHEGDIRRSYTY